MVLGDLKYGDGGVEKPAHLQSHVRGADAFLRHARRVPPLNTEMVEVFDQKLKLGPLKRRKELFSFSHEKPLLPLVRANHELRRALSGGCPGLSPNVRKPREPSPYQGS